MLSLRGRWREKRWRRAILTCHESPNAANPRVPIRCRAASVPRSVSHLTDVCVLSREYQPERQVLAEEHATLRPRGRVASTPTTVSGPVNAPRFGEREVHETTSTLVEGNWSVLDTRRGERVRGALLILDEKNKFVQ